MTWRRVLVCLFNSNSLWFSFNSAVATTYSLASSVFLSMVDVICKTRCRADLDEFVIRRVHADSKGVCYSGLHLLPGAPARSLTRTHVYTHAAPAPVRSLNRPVCRNGRKTRSAVMMEDTVIISWGNKPRWHSLFIHSVALEDAPPGLEHTTGRSSEGHFQLGVFWTRLPADALLLTVIVRHRV